MRRRLRIIILFLAVVIVLSIILVKHTTQNVNLHKPKTSEIIVTKPPTEMAIAVVVCGNRSEETLNMIKSALLFTKDHLHFYIFTDDFAVNRIKPKVG